MLQGSEGDFEAPMVRDLIAVPRAHGDFPDCHIPSEHLVEVATLAVGLRSRLQGCAKIKRPQLLNDGVHVVVEVTTDDDRSIGVLADDIPDDISDSLRSLFEVLLLSWLQVAV